MKTLLATVCILAVAAGAAYAEDPHMSFGPSGDIWYGGQRDEVCQYGFQDDFPGSGWTLGLGQQLGIECPAAGCITAVGFYVDFTVIDGELDIVIYDDGTEVSRTTLAPGAVVQGENEFDIDDVNIAGSACIMLCAVNDTNGFWAVTGEDYTNGPFGSTFFSNTCTCENAFTDNNLTIWAVLCGATPTDEYSWGTIRAMFR